MRSDGIDLQAVANLRLDFPERRHRPGEYARRWSNLAEEAPCRKLSRVSEIVRCNSLSVGWRSDRSDFPLKKPGDWRVESSHLHTLILSRSMVRLG